MASLYLHIPFCRRKCPYCDFYSVEGHSAFLDAYPDLLIRHLQLARQRGEAGAPLETVFFGGGTPSLLPPQAVGRVLRSAAELFGLAEGAEVSLEANPGTVSPASLAAYREAGVNRLSLGVQSLDAASLRLLGRLHTPEQAEAAVRWGRRAGFDNLSCDLMFALPGQDGGCLEGELDRLLALAPEHLSCYGLSVEEGTPFSHLHRSGGLEMPDEDHFSACYRQVHRCLERAGYRHYEISNFARPGFECRHNQVYWQRRPYLGVGAGAHSLRGDGWGERWAVPGDLRAYRELLMRGCDPERRIEGFDRRGAMAETLYLGLRTADGVSDREFRQRFGVAVAEAFPDALNRSGDRVLLRDGCWRMDLDGWLLYDHLISAFL